MKIALYHPWLKAKGGAEKVLLEVLERSGHEVTLFTLYYDEDATFAKFREHDVRVVGSGKPPRGFLDRAVRFGIGTAARKLPLDGFDALVISEAGLGSLAALRNHDLPVACYCHTPLRAALPGFRGTYRDEHHLAMRPVFDIGAWLYSILEARAWTHFGSVMANSDLTKSRIVAKGLAGEKDVDVVHPGVDVDLFEPGEQGDYFLYPSRFRRYKRQDLAIEAFREADLDGMKLVLAGDPQEPDYVEELRELAGDADVEFRTDVADSDWYALYEDAYAVLFLAKDEDWGIVPLEGMAAGKPVIAVAEGGYTTAVADGETGILVEPEPGAVSEAMEALAGDPGRAKAMGETGREAVETYSWDAFIQQFDTHVETTRPAR